MSTPPSFVIRPYCPSDRPAVREIFMATAFHGQPCRQFFDDGEWLADFMTAAYIDFEPEATFVIDQGGSVKGYLTGTLSSVSYRRRWATCVFPRIAWAFFARGLWVQKRTWIFFLNGIGSSLRGEEKLPARLFHNFPAHFHINLHADSRGRGAGTKLAEAFFRAHAEEPGDQRARPDLLSGTSPALFRTSGLPTIGSFASSFVGLFGHPPLLFDDVWFIITHRCVNSFPN